MIEALQRLHETGAADRLDLAFGEWIAARSDEATGLAAALASSEVAQGHVCLDLATAAERLQECGITAPGDWSATLAASTAVAEAGGRAPLVLDGERLYLHRYWCYETRLAQSLRDLSVPAANLDRAALKGALRKLFPGIGNGALDRQALAAAIGATRRLAVVSGGPGTGKTTTLLRLIALALVLDPALDIALAAPTGKAAGRLAEVLASGLASLPAEVRRRVPTEAQTLHRLLGYNAATQRIRHDAANPLAADLVVVDEASMVDIGLMARLVAALKPGARLVLVGDRDQLASVEAGAVFGDICSAAGGFPLAEADALEELLAAPVPRAEGKASPISASIALLKHNYRFGAAGIGALAKAVVAGDADAAMALLTPEDETSPAPSPIQPGDELSPSSPSRPAEKGLSPSPPAGEDTHPSPSSLRGEGWGEGSGRETAAATAALAWHPINNERQLGRELDRVVRVHFKTVLQAASAAEALDRLNRFRLLAAERAGPFGVEGLNARVESLLEIPAIDTWYRGRPVLVTENDYELDLFNGDFGVVWPNEDGRNLLWIPGTGAELRAISPARLPAHATAYALTVHKAQGSEFARVALVLPPRESAVATRELIYTGVTRAREVVEVWATETVFRAAVERRIRRASGLAQRLASD